MDKGSLASEERLMERNSLELKVLSSVGLVGASEGGGAGTDTPAPLTPHVSRRHNFSGLTDCDLHQISM